MTYGNHVGGDVADATGPALGRVVEDVVDADALVLGGERVEVLLEEDILRGDIGKDEVHLGLVALRTTTHNGADNLQHGGDARAAGNHAKVADHVGGVDERALGPADADGLADEQRGHHLGDVALRVGLDEQVKVAGLVVARDGRVGAHNLLGGAVGLGQRRADGDVLADGQAENGLGRGELEAVAVCDACVSTDEGPSLEAGESDLHGYIVGDDRLFLELKLLEDVRLEDLFNLCHGVSVSQCRGRA